MPENKLTVALSYIHHIQPKYESRKDQAGISQAQLEVLPLEVLYIIHTSR